MGVATDFLATLLFLMRTVLLASSQSCCSVITSPNGPQDSLVMVGDGREGWRLLNEWLTVWWRRAASTSSWRCTWILPARWPRGVYSPAAYSSASLRNTPDICNTCKISVNIIQSIYKYYIWIPFLRIFFSFLQYFLMFYFYLTENLIHFSK